MCKYAFLIKICYKAQSFSIPILELASKRMYSDIGLLTLSLVFTCLQYKPFENTAGKGEIARNEQFLLFPQCFLPLLENFCHFHRI